MKYQVLFSLENNEKYSRLSSAAVVIGALKVNTAHKKHFAKWLLLFIPQKCFRKMCLGYLILIIILLLNSLI